MINDKILWSFLSLPDSFNSTSSAIKSTNSFLIFIEAASKHEIIRLVDVLELGIFKLFGVLSFEVELFKNT
jgi:hypothetical protein